MQPSSSSSSQDGSVNAASLPATGRPSWASGAVRSPAFSVSPTFQMFPSSTTVRATTNGPAPNSTFTSNANVFPGSGSTVQFSIGTAPPKKSGARAIQRRRLKRRSLLREASPGQHSWPFGTGGFGSSSTTTTTNSTASPFAPAAGASTSTSTSHSASSSLFNFRRDTPPETRNPFTPGARASTGTSTASYPLFSSPFDSSVTTPYPLFSSPFDSSVTTPGSSQDQSKVDFSIRVRSARSRHGVVPGTSFDHRTSSPSIRAVRASRPSSKKLPKLKDPPPETSAKKDECLICLRVFEKAGSKQAGQKKVTVGLASIDGCDHKYCFECIEAWSKRENSCPQCRKRFSYITGSKRVKQRNQRVAS